MGDPFQPKEKLPHLFSKSIRSESLKTLFHASFLSMLIFALVCLIVGLYVGAYVNPFGYTQNLGVVIVNRDQKFFGNYIVSGLLSVPSLGWQINVNLSDPVQYLTDYYAWIAVVIPENFSYNLNKTIFERMTYNNSAIEIIIEQGRNYSASRFAVSILNATLTAISNSIQLLLLTNYTSYIQGGDPYLLFNTLPLTYTYLHPVYTFGENVASAFTVFLMSTLSLASVLNNLRLYSTLYTKVNIHEVFIARIIHTFFNSFMLSLGICICVLCFGCHMTMGWWAYWIFTWLFMTVMAVIISAFSQLLGPYTSIAFPAFLVASYAGSGAAFPLEMSAPFFHYGLVLPLYHAIVGFRYIIFGTGHIGLAVGVLLIYLFGALAIVYLAYLYQMWKTDRIQKLCQYKGAAIDYEARAASNVLDIPDPEEPLNEAKGLENSILQENDTVSYSKKIKDTDQVNVSNSFIIDRCIN